MSETAFRRISFPDGAQVPCLGQGTWKMGDSASRRRSEIDSLRAGIELGMTLIDTAEMYGNGASEELVGEAIRGLRDKTTIVSKVLPSNASRRGVAKSCRQSLKRLGIEQIDIYLLHWRGGTPLSETVDAFETLRDEGLIRAWGVSNCDVDDLEEVEALGGTCVTDQVLYNLEYRGIEFDLLPESERSGMPLMAYSPVGQGGELLRSPVLTAIGRNHDATPAQIALAWTLRHPGVIAIPKAGTVAHVKQNAKAAAIKLTDEDLRALDAAFPPPRRKERLAML